LWHIADRFLGDPQRYREIEALNPGLEQRDRRFPDHIERGQREVLPAGRARSRPSPARHQRPGLSVVGHTQADTRPSW
jgi:hypothetical protein